MKTVQIFVKLDEMKTVLREVSPEDKVQEILNTVGGSDQDVYVTCEGRMLRKDEQLKSCGVRDGGTIQVTSRMRGGGKHRDKKSKAEKKQAASAKTTEQKFTDEENGDRGSAIRECDKDATIRMIEESEGYRKIAKMISEGRDEEYGMQCFKAELDEKSGLDEGQMKVLECGIRWAVEARRKGRDEQQEQRRQDEQEQRRRGEQGQNTGQEQGKQVRFGQEEQQEETRAENTGEPEVTGRTTAVRTGRGGAGFVRGDLRGVGRTRPAGKAKEQVTEERVSTKAKEEDLATKENSKRRGRKRRNGSEWRQSWELLAHTPQAMSGEEEAAEGEQQRDGEKEEILRLLGE